MNEQKIEFAVVGGGCFWCLEAFFERVKGVLNVESGYSGGSTPQPTYSEVCTGRTNHAEVIKISFDPEQISYQQILDFFWTCHDPTTPNQQGADKGSQYRSVIFYLSDTQKKTAEQSLTTSASRFLKPIVTEIKPLIEFYSAEEEHQNYFNKNRQAPYCRFVIEPKLKRFDF